MRASLENSQRLFAPGFFVRVRVPLGNAKESLLVPDRAILSDQSIKYVLVVDSNNVVQRKDVTVGLLDGKLRLVRAGIDENDRVIINGTQRARPGGKVNRFPRWQTQQPRLPEERSNPMLARFFVDRPVFATFCRS